MSEESPPEPESDAEKPKIGPASPDTPVGKKKKKKAAAEPAAEVTDPRAKEIAVAFDAGNFQRVGELAPELAKSDDPVLAAIGRDYATRIAVDPVQIAFLGLCAVALLTIAWIYIPH